MSNPCSLASGMIFSLNGVRPPSAKAPMMTFLLSAQAGATPAASVDRVDARATPAPALRIVRRLTVLSPLSELLIAFPPSSYSRCTTVVPALLKKHAFAGSSRTPTAEPTGAAKPRPVRKDKCSSPIRRFTKVSWPIGSTT